MTRISKLHGWGGTVFSTITTVVCGMLLGTVAHAATYEQLAAATLADPSPFDAPLALDGEEAIPPIPDEALRPIDASAAARRIGRPPAPDWTRYSFAEALIMGRDNQAFNRPLVVDALTDEQALGTQNLQFPYGGGFRTFYGALGPDCCGWEIGYFGLYDMTASESIPEVPDSYSFPNGFGDPSVLADTATATFNTTINNVEANMFHHFERWNFYREAWLEVDWLTGFRYVGVEDAAQVLLVCCEGDDSTLYRLNTRNNMFGGQIGGRARLNWQRWALEAWGKAAILGNAAEQEQDPIVSTISGQIRDGRSSTGETVGMVADINISAIYRLTDVWGIRMGFNTIWLGGTALAANQFDFSQSTTSGSILQEGGSMFLSGVNLGLEGRW